MARSSTARAAPAHDGPRLSDVPRPRIAPQGRRRSRPRPRIRDPVNVASGEPVTFHELPSQLGEIVGRADLLCFGARPDDPREPQHVVATPWPRDPPSTDPCPWPNSSATSPSSSSASGSRSRGARAPARRGSTRGTAGPSGPAGVRYAPRTPLTSNRARGGRPARRRSERRSRGHLRGPLALPRLFPSRTTAQGLGRLKHGSDPLEARPGGRELQAARSSFPASRCACASTIRACAVSWGARRPRSRDARLARSLGGRPRRRLRPA
jgi:hypothetical protein